MRTRTVVLALSLVFGLTLTGCATPSAGAGSSGSDVPAEPTAASESPVIADPEAAAARAQAQAWVDSAVLPPEAVASENAPLAFGTYTAWPCGPIEKLEAYWTIPSMTVTQAANWLMAHPPAGLMSTIGRPYEENPAIDGASVGFIPKPDAQEGIVYSVARKGTGVAVKAEVAELTASAVCPTPPGGGMWGAPGQG